MMMRRWMLGLFVGLLLSHTAAASDTALTDANSLQSLLDSVKQFENTQRQQYAERIARFKQDQAEQARRLREAREQWQAAQTLSEELTDLFEQNEADIAALKTQLEQKSGNLGELFGVVRQVASDLQARFRHSYITPQYPERIDAIAPLARAQTLPEIPALRTLWFELQRDMTASGQIATFNAPVISAQGVEATVPVVRLGDFGAFHQDRYLTLRDDIAGLREIARQPATRHTKLLQPFAATPAGSVADVSLDPSRGAILSLIVQKPNAWERVQQGGYVGYVILLIGAVGLLLVLERLLSLSLIQHRVKRQLRSNQPNPDNPLGQVLTVCEQHRHLDLETLELKLDEEILRHIPGLERNITTIKVLAAIAPLLGLLGTVVGMIQTFQVITLVGTGDPKLMAGGISEALVTTMLGLIVAVPLILCHNSVNNRSRRLIKVLEEQSAGYVAKHAEQLASASGKAT